MTNDYFKNGNGYVTNYGFIPDEVTPDHYQLGAVQLVYDPINPKGDWGAFLPSKELQRKWGVETQNCTAYATLSALQTLLRYIYGRDYNFSERYTGVLAETTKNGNSPHKVAEVIRHEGLIDDALLPFDESIDTWDKYYSPKPMTEKYLEAGHKFLEQYEIGHEWVFHARKAVPLKEKQELMMKMLKASPLCISVYAWKQNDEGLYFQEMGDPNTHWVMVYGYKEGEYWKLWDSYDNMKKKLAWGAVDASWFCKRYAISKKAQEKIYLPFWKRIINAIKEFLGL